MSQEIEELFQIAKLALSKKNKRGFDQAIYKILSLDLECEKAWKILYHQYGKGRTYEEFRARFTQKYFSQQKNTIANLPIDNEARIHQSTNGHQSNIKSEIQPRRELRGNFTSILQAVAFVSYSACYAVPAVTMGQFLLILFIEAMREGFNMGGFLGLIMWPVVLLFGLGLFSAMYPIVGTILYVVLMAILLINGIVGGIAGLGLGVICAVVYFLTRWTPSVVSFLCCSIAGGAIGFMVAEYWIYALDSTWFLNDTMLFIHYGLLTIVGICGGVVFVLFADETEVSTSTHQKVLKNVSKRSSFSPISFYLRVTNFIGDSAEIGKNI